MRHGMTLGELLVAMLVLLVGIWTVAAGFPRLAQTVVGEGERAAMTRLAERQAQQAADVIGGPFAVVGATPAGPRDPTVLPWSRPWDYVHDADDPSTPPPPNGMQNMLDVIGEVGQIPAIPAGADPATTPAVYVLRQGPAMWVSPADRPDVFAVYQPLPLVRDDNLFGVAADNSTVLADDKLAELYTETDGSGTPVHLEGRFYVASDGTVHFIPPREDPQGRPVQLDPAGVVPAEIECDYVWVDNDLSTGVPVPRSHTVTGEVVPWQRVPTRPGPPIWVSAPVSGVTLVSQIIPSSFVVRVRNHYQALLEPTAPVPGGPPPAVLDFTYGTVLRFPADEAGKIVTINYRLRPYDDGTGPGNPANGRRNQLMIETHTVPAVPSYSDPGGRVEHQVRLSLGGLTMPGEPAAFENTGTYVLAVDPQTGQHFEADGLGGNPLFQIGYTSPWDGNWQAGADNGIVSFIGDTTNPVGVAGRELTFYYRTLNDNSVQVQKPAATFVQDIWRDVLQPLPGWAEYRWFYLRQVDPGLYGRYDYEVLFPACCAGETVSLSYTAVDSAGAQRKVQDEVHTLTMEPTGTDTVGDWAGVIVTLDEHDGDVLYITDACGVSVKAWANWRFRGRPRETSVETLLRPAARVLMPEVP